MTDNIINSLNLDADMDIKQSISNKSVEQLQAEVENEISNDAHLKNRDSEVIEKIYSSVTDIVKWINTNSEFIRNTGIKADRSEKNIKTTASIVDNIGKSLNEYLPNNDKNIDNLNKEIDALKKENQELKDRLSKLEELIKGDKPKETPSNNNTSTNRSLFKNIDLNNIRDIFSSSIL